MYFTLQKRRGQDEEKGSRGLAGLIVATLDTVLDNKVQQTNTNHTFIILSKKIYS
jgi:hypothetical protein